MCKRKLQELNLLDDFLFNKLVSHPEYGEPFSRELLRIILGKEIGSLTVVPQKVYYGRDTDRHGARLDVYLEEDRGKERATVYDVEPEKRQAGDLETLPRRSRFYHSVIDAEILQSGETYRNLKEVIVILILPEDPLGADRMVYTIENRCLEMPEFSYDDGARTVMLYTKGREGNPTKELRELLAYIEESRAENATNNVLKKIHRMVEHVKQDKEVSIEYMKIFEREEMLREEGMEEGMKRGMELGLQRGREQERQAREQEQQRAREQEQRAREQERRADTAERRVTELEQAIAELEKTIAELTGKVKKGSAAPTK